MQIRIIDKKGPLDNYADRFVLSATLALEHALKLHTTQ